MKAEEKKDRISEEIVFGKVVNFGELGGESRYSCACKCSGSGAGAGA